MGQYRNSSSDICVFTSMPISSSRVLDNTDLWLTSMIGERVEAREVVSFSLQGR